MKLLVFLYFFVCVFFIELEAQTKGIKVISGTVKDELALPLPGVTVKLKGTNLGTATDKDGNTL